MDKSGILVSNKGRSGQIRAIEGKYGILGSNKGN